MIRISGAIVALAAAFSLAPLRASLSNPDEPMAVPVSPDGLGEALPFDIFNQRMITLTNIGDPRLLDGKMNRDRIKVLARVRAIANPQALPPDRAAILAVDWLRLGNQDGLYINKAVDLLAPHTRDRRPNYFVHTTLAAVHLARGEYLEAIDMHDLALECGMPEQVPGWSPAQRNWIAAIDRDYLPVYLRIRKAEADPATRHTPETEEPTPLFPIPVRGQAAEPVRFVNDAGKYEPGRLAQAERAKLPRDAVAIVQQLLLWFPTDSRLYWLLAELYAAAGKFDAAHTILEQCTWSRKYTPRLLLEHRTLIAAADELQQKEEAVRKQAADAARKETEQREAEAGKQAAQRETEDAASMLRGFGLYLGAVVLIAVIALVRTVYRRGNRTGGISCCR